MKNNQNYTTTISVDQTPDEVFNAINNVRGWWSQAIEGATYKLGAEFKYHLKDIHCCAFTMFSLIESAVLRKGFMRVRDQPTKYALYRWQTAKALAPFFCWRRMHILCAWLGS